MGYQVAFEAAGVVEVELFQALAGREAGRPDAPLAAVGVTGGNFPLQAGDQVLLVRPGLLAGPGGEPFRGVAQGRGFQRPEQVRQLSRRAANAISAS